MPYESPDYPLSDLMTSVANGKIQLPDFQREWKWDDDRIASLLASISVGHPIGVLMMLEVGGSDVNFAAKPLAGAEKGATGGPERLLLDGQQRMTSLFQALASDHVVQTSDGRKKRLTRWYYLEMGKALADPGDREEAIRSIPEGRVVREDFGRSIVLDISTLGAECRAEMFPLSRVFNSPATNEWMMHYIQLDNAGMSERVQRWNRFQQEVLANFTSYLVPVIVLTKGTPKEAVCTVFEKVNTGGVPLNVFELLTATFAAENFRLKDDWKARQDELRKRKVNSTLESSDFLQAVALLATRARKLAWTGSDSDAPGVSCKRRDILRLTLEEYRQWADPATEGFDWAATFLAQEGIFVAADVPYRTQLVPLAAIRATLGDEIDNHGTIARIRQWYWSGVLGELYGGAIETRFARDLEQIVDWIKSDGAAPGTVTAGSFNSSRLLTLRTRNSAAYKGLYALVMRNGCLDWQRHKPMSLASFFDYRVDIHHIFPKAWCNKNNVDDARRESIVNKTAISSDTNRYSIGGRAPSDYLPILEQKAGISPGQLDEIVETHAIDASALRADDFDRFFEDRKRQLLKMISAAMAKPAIIDDENIETELSLFEPEPDDLPDDADQFTAWVGDTSGPSSDWRQKFQTAEPQSDGTPRAWLIRAGSSGEDEDLNIENGLAVVGFGQVPDLTDVSTWDQMREIVRHSCPGDSESKIGNVAGQLWALRSRVRAGDLVVLPLKTTPQVALGIVTAGYKYRNVSGVGRRHMVSVHWKRVNVPRSAVQQDLLHSLGAFMTVCEITRNDGAWRLQQILETANDPGPRAESVEAAAAS